MDAYKGPNIPPSNILYQASSIHHINKFLLLILAILDRYAFPTSRPTQHHHRLRRQEVNRKVLRRLQRPRDYADLFIPDDEFSMNEKKAKGTKRKPPPL